MVFIFYVWNLLNKPPSCPLFTGFYSDYILQYTSKLFNYSRSKILVYLRAEVLQIRSTRIQLGTIPNFRSLQVKLFTPQFIKYRYTPPSSMLTVANMVIFRPFSTSVIARSAIRARYLHFHTLRGPLVGTVAQFQPHLSRNMASLVSPATRVAGSKKDIWYALHCLCLIQCCRVPDQPLTESGMGLGPQSMRLLQSVRRLRSTLDRVSCE